MTRNSVPRLLGYYKVVKGTMILLFNINTYGSTANGGQHLQKFLIFIQDLHRSADHQCLIRSLGNHGECKPFGRPPNQRETMPLDCTKNMGAEENGDNINQTAKAAGKPGSNRRRQRFEGDAEQQQQTHSAGGK